jgi:transposase
MRYPDGGGLTAAGRVRRESVRLQAAGMFEQDVSPVRVAHRLRVSTKSAYQWRRRWRAGGDAALASKGAGGAVCRLSAGQVARLRAALEGGPAAWANMKGGLGNLAAADADQLTAIIKNRLKTIQYRPALINGLPRPDPGSPSNPNRPRWLVFFVRGGPPGPVIISGELP